MSLYYYACQDEAFDKSSPAEFIRIAFLKEHYVLGHVIIESRAGKSLAYDAEAQRTLLYADFVFICIMAI